MVVKSDPGQAVIWLAFACLIAGLVLSFYFPRRRAWARIEADRVGVAFLADPYVDREREFGLLVETLERRLDMPESNPPIPATSPQGR